MEQTETSFSPDEAGLLGKATRKATEKLGFSRDELANILGHDLSCAIGGTIPYTQSGERDRQFLQCYRSAQILLGGDLENMKHWFSTRNKHLGGIPRELMQSEDGLEQVRFYLEWIRERDLKA